MMRIGVHCLLRISEKTMGIASLHPSYIRNYLTVGWVAALCANTHRSCGSRQTRKSLPLLRNTANAHSVLWRSDLFGKNDGYRRAPPIVQKLKVIRGRMGRGVLCRYPSNLSKRWVVALLFNPPYRIKFLRRAARRPDAIDLVHQTNGRRSIGRFPTPVGKENVSRAVNQEVAPCLLNIIFSVLLPLHTRSQQFKIKLQCRE